jgi:EAL domain-containing protein (putative c-di-GMP-specific phosphodiesterase class I)
MYIAKARGKGCYAVFSPDMHAEAAERLQLEADLAQALSQGQFVLHYQPIIDLPSGRWLGFEALLRWQHPRRGLLLPAAFLNVAEEAGHMIAIGKWGLREACLQLARWQALAPSAQPLYMSVNLTMRQFLHPTIVDDIADVLAESGLAPGQLLVEITESVALEDAEITRRTLGALRRLGVRLAIDDFGTGFSALSYLKQFDVDVLKLDRSFLIGIEHDAGAAVLVSALIAFAQRLNLALIIEGVETDGQRMLIRDMGCQACQGFFFARPLAPPVIEERLRCAAF